jgi:hypothetical protein
MKGAAVLRGLYYIAVMNEHMVAVHVHSSCIDRVLQGSTAVALHCARGVCGASGGLTYVLVN